MQYAEKGSEWVGEVNRIEKRLSNAANSIAASLDGNLFVSGHKFNDSHNARSQQGNEQDDPERKRDRKQH
jgi:hypothetical protein